MERRNLAKDVKSTSAVGRRSKH